MKPPITENLFYNNSPYMQARILAYEQIRQIENADELAIIAGVKIK